MKKTMVAMLFVLAPSVAKSESSPRLTVEYNEGIDNELPSAKPKTVTASSTLADKLGAYAAKNAADGKPGTAWCEGVDGLGEGEWLRFEFAHPVAIAEFDFTPFYAKNKNSLSNNEQVERMRVEMEGGFSREVDFGSKADLWCDDSQLSFPAPFVNFRDPKNGGKAVKSDWIKFTILKVRASAKRKFQDTCISDIGVLVLKD